MFGIGSFGVIRGARVHADYGVIVQGGVEGGAKLHQLDEVQGTKIEQKVPIHETVVHREIIDIVLRCGAKRGACESDKVEASLVY